MSAVCASNTERVAFSNSKNMDSDFLLCGFTRAIFGEIDERWGNAFISFYDHASWMVGGGGVAECWNGK